ncbi:hypothetical protein Tco_1335283 [Tanacetum coccineum]
MVDKASGATRMDVPSTGQATPSHAEGEKNTKDAGTNLKDELIDLLGKDIVTQYYTKKLLLDKYYDKMLKRKKNPKITNCEVLTKKGPITLKIYREDGSDEVISNLKTRVDQLTQTKQELKIDLNQPLKEQDPLDELIDLANKKRKRTSDLRYHSSPLASFAEVSSASALQVLKRLGKAETCVSLLEGLQGRKKLLYVKRNKAISLGNVTSKVGIERIVTASGPVFGDWQQRLATLTFAFGGIGIYYAGDWALWKSQMADHTSDWLRVVLLSGLGQTMNGKTYCCVLYYRLGVPVFSALKSCSACSRVFAGDIYGDHAVSCAGIVGIKHRHNLVRDTIFDICFQSGILAGKEVDIELGGGRDKPLRPADMLLYSWDGGIDVRVDLIRSSPLTQTGLVDFVPSRAVIDATHCKLVKYEAKCADIGYGFLSFLFSLLGELEKDVVALLKRIRKFFVTQDI